jgi:DNA/RNA endonuclease YhcR with UshA esterase domain
MRGFVCGLAGLALTVMVLASCGGSVSNTAPTMTSPTSPPPTVTEGSVIGWSEAASRVGQTVTVEGPVVSADHVGVSRSPLILNVGLAAPDSSRFLIVIPASLVSKFAEPPDVLYVGQLVRVVGRVEQRQGLAAITIQSPRAIKVAQ